MADGEATYINEPLQVLVQTGQILLALVVLRNQGLLALQQLLSSLFELLALRMLVVDARDHQVMLVGLPMLGKQLQELFHGD